MTGFSISKIPNISKWLVTISLGGALLGFPVFLFLDPMLIFNGFFVQLIRPFDYVVLITCAALPDFSEKDNELPIRPPGSIENNYFNTLCIRCGSCIKVCPAQILRHETSFGMGLLTPIIKFNDGYCLENCNLCSVVCPSGAITSFTTEAKKILRIGKAVVQLDNCLLMKMKECAVCKNACHYNSIDFVSFDGKSLKMRPAINGNNCNGCGACSVICPENCIKIQAI